MAPLRLMPALELTTPQANNSNPGTTGGNDGLYGQQPYSNIVCRRYGDSVVTARDSMVAEFVERRNSAFTHAEVDSVCLARHGFGPATASPPWVFLIACIWLVLAGYLQLESSKIRNWVFSTKTLRPLLGSGLSQAGVLTSIAVGMFGWGWWYLSAIATGTHPVVIWVDHSITLAPVPLLMSLPLSAIAAYQFALALGWRRSTPTRDAPESRRASGSFAGVVAAAVHFAASVATIIGLLIAAR